MSEPMSNPISDPGLTREEAEKLAAICEQESRMPARSSGTIPAILAGAGEKLDAALSAPENNRGVEKAVEGLERWMLDGELGDCEPIEAMLLPKGPTADLPENGSELVRLRDVRALLLTQQPVLPSDEDRERIDAAFERLAGFVPAGRHNEHLNVLRNLAQQHYGVEGAAGDA